MSRATVHRIVSMINGRRDRLNEEWNAMEKGTKDSGENLAIQNELVELKWQILDAYDAETLTAPDFPPADDLSD